MIARSRRARSMSARPRRSRIKIARTVGALDAARFDLKYSAGPLAHGKMMRCVELYGTKVAPRVAELLAETQAALAPA